MQSIAKSLQQEVSDREKRSAMSQELQRMMSITDFGLAECTFEELQGRMRTETDAFCARHSEQAAFVAYFKDLWADRPGVY